MNPVLIMLFLLVPIVGGLLAATPWLMPRSECFAVTIPVGAYDDPHLKRLRNAYLRIMLIVTIACMLSWVVVGKFVDLSQSQQPDVNSALVLLSCVSVCLPIFVSFVLMLYFRSRVQAIKREAGWEASGPTAAAVVGEPGVPEPISIAWNLLYLPIIATLVAFAFAMYDAFPDQIPMHISVNGAVTDWVDKSVGALLFPALMAAFLGVVFTACHWGIIHSKKPVDPAAPVSSSLAYGSFARLQSVLLLVGGLVISAVTGTGFFLAALGSMQLDHVAMLMTGICLAFVAVYLVASIVYGQSGARIAAHVGDADANGMPADSDRYWKLGIFYVNANDPSIFVPKRFGVGWTLNLGRVSTWGVIAGFAALITGFVLLVNAIVS